MFQNMLASFCDMINTSSVFSKNLYGHWTNTLLKFICVTSESLETWNGWVGRELKDHLVPIPLCFESRKKCFLESRKT